MLRFGLLLVAAALAAGDAAAPGIASTASVRFGGGRESRAFVLPAGKSGQVRRIDLGEAEPLDGLIAEFRAALPRGGAAADKAGKALRVCVMLVTWSMSWVAIVGCTGSCLPTS